MTFPPGMPGDEPAGGITAGGNRPVAAGVIHGGVHSGDTTVMHLAALPVLAEAADNLAREVRWTLEQEQKRRKIYAPEPLPARWRAAAHLTDPQARIGVCREGDSIADTYRKVPQGRLIILGPAGSGKTVLAQRLALGYLSVRESSGAVPVVFSIGSWDPSAATLEQWMAGRLLRDHPFLDKATAVGLIADHRILAVLDGFDELADDLRAMALEELNSAANRPLVLTSRLPEYESTTMDEGVLYRAAAIELTGPSLEEAVAYLAAAGNKPAWTDVNDRLRSAPDDEACALLTELLRNPLMAALARATYKRRNPTELLEKRFRTPEDAERHLLSGFLLEAYENQKGEDRSRWGPDRARTALGYLAAHLKQLGGSALAWWEIGTTLPLLQRMLAVGTVCGVLCWFLLGAAALPELPSHEIPLGLVAVSVEAAAIGLAFGLTHGLTARFRGPPKPSRIQIRIRTGTRRKARRAGTKFRNGFIIAAVCSGIAMIAELAAVTLAPRLWEEFLANTRIGADRLPFTLSIILGTGLTLGLGLGLLSWLEVPVEAGTANGPLALLRTNRATVRAQSLVIGLTSGLILGGIYGFFVGPLLGCGDGIILAIVVGTGWALSLTAWGQWVVFARLWLPLTGRLPWAAAAFLDDGHQRGVLRQSGAIYQFRHTRLQDHLAVAQAERIPQITNHTRHRAPKTIRAVVGRAASRPAERPSHRRTRRTG
jgi:NACHT domain